jgi:hypothetical protein
VTGIVGLLPNLGGAGRIERSPHKVERMPDQAPVIVAERIGDAWHRQAVLIALLGQRDTIAFLRKALADDFETDLVIVAFHLVKQALAPQAALG